MKNNLESLTGINVKFKDSYDVDLVELIDQHQEVSKHLRAGRDKNTHQSNKQLRMGVWVGAVSERGFERKTSDGNLHKLYRCGGITILLQQSSFHSDDAHVNDFQYNLDEVGIA